MGYSRACASSAPEVVFQEQSHCGNGVVAVVRHGPWLALRFDISEQGLTFTGREGDADYRDGAALPHVLGFEYLRVMASAATACARPRVVCISQPARSRFVLTRAR